MAERKYWEIDSAISSSYQYIYETEKDEMKIEKVRVRKDMD